MDHLAEDLDRLKPSELDLLIRLRLVELDAQTADGKVKSYRLTHAARSLLRNTK